MPPRNDAERIAAEQPGLCPKCAKQKLISELSYYHDRPRTFSSQKMSGPYTAICKECDYNYRGDSNATA